MNIITQIEVQSKGGADEDADLSSPNTGSGTPTIEPDVCGRSGGQS